jgi:hypothetical protein
MHSNVKPAACSDPKPAGVPILMLATCGAPLRVDGMMFSFSCWVKRSSGWFGHTPFAHALAGELDPVGIVNDAVEDGIESGSINKRLTGSCKTSKRDGSLEIAASLISSGCPSIPPSR